MGGAHRRRPDAGVEKMAGPADGAVAGEVMARTCYDDLSRTPWWALRATMHGHQTVVELPPVATVARDSDQIMYRNIDDI